MTEQDATQSNGLNTPLIRDTKILNLSTQSSSGMLLNGDAKSKVLYELKNYIDYENDDSVEYISVSMPYVVLCNSNYIVNATNNTLLFQHAGGTATITFAYGNYTASTFQAAFQAAVLPYKNGATLDIRYNQTIQKYEMYSSVSTFSLLAGSTCDYILGFSGTFAIPQGVWTALPRCANFLPNARFHVCADFLNNGTILGTTQTQNSTVLATIPNTSKNNNLIVYESDQNEFLLKSCALNSLTLSIVDDNYNLIDFNGVASYFTLRFSIYRRRLPKVQAFSKVLELASKIETGRLYDLLDTVGTMDNILGYDLEE